MWLARIRLLLVTLCAGSLWTVGLVVAPTLFSNLADRALAGVIAGMLFHMEGMLAGLLGFAIVVLLQLERGMDARLRRALCLAIVVMILFAAGMQWGLQPMMEAVRAEAHGSVLEGAARSKFAVLHIAASLCYVAQCLLASYVVVRNPR